MSCANHDSSQCSTPASGAMIASTIRYCANGSPCLTAATANALATPTPISAATRTIPNTSTTENFTFQGTTWRSSSRNAPAQLRPSARRMASVGSWCALASSAWRSSRGMSRRFVPSAAGDASEASDCTASSAWAPISLR